MGFFDSMNISATALTAQQTRLDIISQNLANVETTRTADGTPYKRKVVLFQEKSGNESFSSHLSHAMNVNTRSKTRNSLSSGSGVRVSSIVNDTSEGPKIYDPEHPDADEDGYVEKPNVNVVNEMVNMLSASRSYEANVTAMNTTKAMAAKTLEIGR